MPSDASPSLLRRILPSLVPPAVAVIALAAFALQAAALQADSGGVEGRVTAESGIPIPGVEVTAVGSEVRAYSNEHGYFVLRPVPSGEATLRFRRLGYGAHVQPVAVRTGTATRIEVRLATTPVGLDPLVVRSRRSRMIGDPLVLAAIPGSAHFLSLEDLEARRLPHDNVHDVLRRIPGVNVQDEEGYGLRPNIGLRATGVSRSSRITLMEDGVLIAPAPYAAPAAYYFPVAGRMEAIEVRKGSSQVRYGPRTIGGAVNLVSTSIPERSSWLVDTQGGENQTLKLRARGGGSGDHLGWMAETYQIRTDGFKELQGGGDTGFRVSDYLVKLRANTHRDAPRYQEIEVKVGYHDETSNETYLGLTPEDFRSNPLQRYAASANDVMDAEQSQLQLRHFFQPTERVDLTTTAYRMTFARNWYKLQSVEGTGLATVLDDPEMHRDRLAVLRGADSGDDALTVRANNREYRSEGIQSTLGLRVETGAARHDLEIGVRLHRDFEDRFQWEDGYRMAAGVPVQTSEGRPGTHDNRVGEARAWSVYLQDEMGLGERWTLVPGVRYENIQLTRTDFPTEEPSREEPTRIRSTTVSAVMPGVGAVFQAAPTVHLFGGVHRGFSPPGPGATEETRPEESINYEMGARMWRSGLRMQVAGFFNDYRNILGQATLATGESGSGDLYNGGAVQALGVETSLEYDLSWHRDLPVRVPLSLAHTYSRATFRTSFSSSFDSWGTVETGDRLPYLPEHQFSAGVGVEDAAWSLTLSAAGNSAMRVRAGSGPMADDDATDGFVVVNLEGRYRLPGALGGSLYGGIQNLEDRRYIVARRPAGARPGLPRTIFAGIRISY